MKIFFTLMGLLFMSLNGHTYQKNCSSFDGNLKYYFDSPDGGAPRQPNESLFFNGQLLIDDQLGQNFPIRAVFVDFAQQSEWESKPNKQDDYLYTKSVTRLSVSNISDLQIIFQDLVFCQTIQYVGDPLP